MQSSLSPHSFAVMAYKDSFYLEECLLSLLNQKLKSRITIFTSTPTSSQAAISKKYGIPLVVNKESSGIASDWSFAYNNCEGEFVTLVHQDDVYLPFYAQECLLALSNRSKKDNLIVFTWYNDLISGKERAFNLNFVIKKLLLLPYIINPSIKSQLIKRAVLSFGNPIPCPSVMFHKAKIGRFDFYGRFNCNMDWDAWLRISEKVGSFIFVNKKLMLHRVYKNSQTSLQIDCNGRRNEDFLIFQRLWPYPFARMLSALYAFGYRMNDVK